MTTFPRRSNSLKTTSSKKGKSNVMSDILLRACSRSPLPLVLYAILLLVTSDVPYSLCAEKDFCSGHNKEMQPSFSASTSTTDHERMQYNPEAAGENDVIIITATKKELPLTIKASPKSSHLALSASDGADYLKTIPGFTFIRNGGTNGDSIFRGMFGSRLKMLIEGSEILGACSSRMDSPSAYIFPENFDLITLIKGPQSVLWGPGASAGTLQFERIRPQFDTSGMRFHGSILSGSSSRLDQNIDTAFGNEFGYLRLIGNISRSGNYRDSERRQVHSGWHKWNSDLSFGITPSSETLMELTMGHGNGDAKYASRNMDGTRFKRKNIGVRVEHNGTGGCLEKVAVQGWYRYADHVMDNYGRRTLYPRSSSICPVKNPPGFRSMRSNVDRTTVGGRSIGTWQWYKLQLQGGTDVQINWHRKNVGGNWKEDSCFQDSGAFAEIKWWLRPEDSLISGIRIENTVVQYTHIKEMKRRKETYPATFLRLEHRSKTLPLMIYCGTGTSERFPDYWELITLKSGRGSEQDAFYRLKREKTTQLDFGAHFHFKKLNSWISAYSGQVKDFILFRYDIPRLNAYRAENIDALIRGTEVGLGYRISNHWRLENNISWSFGERKNTHKSLPQIPPLEGRLTLGWSKGDWSAIGLWRLVAAQKHIAIDEGNVVGRDFGHSKGFGVLSSYLTWKASEQLKINAGIDNLLNRHYSEHLNLAGNPGLGYAVNVPLIEIGRTIWARANLSF